jgi:hypothetical protein
MAIWLLSAVVFFWAGLDAQESTKTVLPRYQHRISVPRFGDTEINGMSTKELRDTANGIADTHDKSVEELERSIHQSALLSRNLNFLSVAFSLLGFATQFFQYRRERAEEHKKHSHPKHHRG